jgi:hypothetical protein
MTEWVPFPKVTATVTHGKGKSIVSGVVSVAINDGETVHVSTDGSHNVDDSPALTYRESSWLIGLHLTRNDDGTWRETSRTSYGVTRRGVSGSDSTPSSYRAAIVAAISAGDAGSVPPRQRADQDRRRARRD